MTIQNAITLLTRYDDQSLKERIVLAGPGALVVLLWTFTALRFRPPLDFLLPFALVLIGAGIVAHMLLHWMCGRSSSPVTLASCVAETAFACLGGVLLTGRAPVPFEVAMQFVAAGSLVVLVRVQRREKDSQR